MPGARDASWEKIDTMLTLGEVRRDATIIGIEPGQVVCVVTTEPVGDNALTVYYKTSDGCLLERMLFRTDEATLALAKGTSVSGVAEARVLASGKGAVRLLRYAEYPADWSPEHDTRTPGWEALHHLNRALQSGGESASGTLLARMPARTEAIRQLAYRLYTLCERQGQAEEARAYNELIASWEAIEAASHTTGHVENQIELTF